MQKCVSQPSLMNFNFKPPFLWEKSYFPPHTLSPVKLYSNWRICWVLWVIVLTPIYLSSLWCCRSLSSRFMLVYAERDVAAHGYLFVWEVSMCLLGDNWLVLVLFVRALPGKKEHLLHPPESWGNLSSGLNNSGKEQWPQGVNSWGKGRGLILFWKQVWTTAQGGRKCNVSKDLRRSTNVTTL